MEAENLAGWEGREWGNDPLTLTCPVSVTAASSAPMGRFFGEPACLGLRTVTLPSLDVELWSEEYSTSRKLRDTNYHYTFLMRASHLASMW